MEVTRLKSPITVRSSGRQSRLGDCAAAVTVMTAEIETAPSIRMTGMYTSTGGRRGAVTPSADEEARAGWVGGVAGAIDAAAPTRARGRAVRRSHPWDEDPAP